MRRAIEHIPAGKSDLKDVRASVTLSFEDRHRRRIRMIDDSGDDFLLDLPHAVRLGHGDGLRLETGGMIMVKAANEPVLTISADDQLSASKLAWHVGNRHTPLQVLDDGRLRIIDDHVIKAMIEGLGGHVVAEIAPFDPLNGAYHGLGGGHGHSHSHGHDHFETDDGGQNHAHSHDHDHTHGGNSHGHSHRHSDGHSHNHGQGHSHSHPHEGPHEH